MIRFNWWSEVETSGSEH